MPMTVAPRRAAWWPPLIVLAVIVLLPVGRTAELPIAIGAIAGLALFARRRIDLRSDDAMRLGVALFACYWIPALVSAAAPVAPGKTWSTIATSLRFLPFVPFAIDALRGDRAMAAIPLGVAAIVALWIIDAYVQIATGQSLAGAAEAERISGIFGAGNLKLGPVLAVLSPFVLLVAREQWGRIGLALAFVALLVPILLAGSRAAWLMYAIVTLAIAWRETKSARRFAIVLGLMALAAGAIVVVALDDSTRFGARVERSLMIFRGTESAVDTASAGRLSIWRTALAMSRAHPVTGVGVRGFRYAYPDYAAPGDRFVDTTSDIGASHAHQIVLEVLSETGLVGIAFWLIGAGLAIRAWRRADGRARERALAPALALVAMCFPFNTHFAFYSAWWGLFFWWLVAVYCAALGARGEDANPSLARSRAAA